MRAYHEVSPDQLQSILTNGLKKEPRGTKGDDRWIVEADAYLDARRPKHLIEAHVSRADNMYAYYATDTLVIAITDGTHVPLQDFIEAKKGALVEVQLHPKRCYVSDLDTYDTLKDALRLHKGSQVLELLAKSYWGKVVLLHRFQPHMTRRPEIMVTYDLTPQEIRQC